MAVESKLFLPEVLRMEPKYEETQENTCVVCYKGVEIYSIGQCDHPVCFECSSRMRVLCQQNECPICRQDMPTVIFTETVEPFKEPIDTRHNLKDDRFKIIFSSEKVKRAYQILLAHVCPICEGKSFPSFTVLRDHVRRVHQLNYCDLCVDNLKILPRERRCYTRQELAHHRRNGDPDDRSHRGHPLCEFCNTRFMDNDELYRHLRRNHLYCHFCDADGYDHYYSTYDFLRDHFRTEHYLCEEGECYDEKFTAVFRTEIDLKAHRASVHGRALGKAATKQARTLELEFTLAPRARISRNNRIREEEMDIGAVGGTEEPVSFTKLKTDCMEEFPSLGGKGGAQPSPVMAHQSKLTIRSSGHGYKMTEENFPALHPEGTTVSLQVNSERPISSIVNGKQPKLAIQVNHRPFTSRASSRGLREQDFPALAGKASAPVVNIASTQWSSSKKPEPKVSLVKQNPDSGRGQSQPSRPFTMENDFPSLSSRFNNSCTFQKDSKSSRAPPPSLLSANSWAALGGQSSDSDPGPVVASRSKKKKSKSKNPPPDEFNPSQSSKKQTASEGKAGQDSPRGKKKSKEAKKPGNKSDSQKLKMECTNNNTLLNNNNTVDENKKPGSTEAKSGNKAEEENENRIGNQQLDIGRADNFPVLSRSRPPGFNGISRVPPGLEGPKWDLPKREMSKAPPGLEGVKAPPGLNPPPGFNVTNNFFPPLVDFNSFVFPPDFAKRNSALINEIVMVIGQERLDNFKETSVAFRSGIISAEEYYNNCEETIGTSVFQELFPELLALLPDIAKQQELWTLYKSSVEKDTCAKNRLEACATCRQVVKCADLRDHLTSHALENQFPVLNGAPPGLSKAWSNK